MCRAQYAADDIAEAHAICGTGPVDGLANQSMSLENTPVSSEGHRISSRFRTIRLPAWVNFSYRRPLHERQLTRPRNPFQPLPPTLPNAAPVDGLPEGSTYNNSQEWTAGDYKSPNLPQHQSSPGAQPNRSTPAALPLVIHRPPLRAWDDMPQIDLPYDNPYYSRHIQDILWLPCDPVGLLNLDKTVSLTRSLTSAPGSCDLGTWPASTGLPASPELATTASGVPGQEGKSVVLVGSRQYSGDEEIALPHGIAVRVNDIDQEEDVETTAERRPSLFQRKSSVSSMSARTPKGTDDIVRPPIGLKSRSGFSQSSRHRGSSFSASHTVAQRQNSGLSVQALQTGKLPSNEQADIAPKPSIITTHEAVISEVIVEETLAAEERKKEEAEESGEQPPSSSWLSIWLKSRKKQE